MAVIPKMSRIFAILLPTILPNAILLSPFKEAAKLTTSSGIDVPNATIVKPMTSEETPNLFASEEEPFIK